MVSDDIMGPLYTIPCPRCLSSHQSCKLTWYKTSVTAEAGWGERCEAGSWWQVSTHIHHLHHHTPITPELWPRPSFIYTFSEKGAPWLQYIIFILSPWPLVAPVSRGQRLATVMSWVGSGPGLGWGKQSIHYLVCHYCHSPRHQPQQQTTSPGPLLILLLTLLIKHFLL